MLVRYDIISDTHGFLSNDLLRELEGADVIVHAGDICSPSDYRTLSNIARVKMCLGNNDWAYEYGPMVKNRVFFIGSGLKWQVVHYRQKLDLSMSDIAIFGHTHTPVLQRDKWTNTLVMNPGSPTYPRRSKASMGRIVCDDGQIVEAKLITLD